MTRQYLDLPHGKIARLQAVRAASKPAPVWCSSWVEFTALPRGGKRNWAAYQHVAGSAARPPDHFEMMPNEIAPQPRNGGYLAGGDEPLLFIRSDPKFMYADVLAQNVQIRELLAVRARKAKAAKARHFLRAV